MGPAAPFIIIVKPGSLILSAQYNSTANFTAKHTLYFNQSRKAKLVFFRDFFRQSDPQQVFTMFGSSVTRFFYTINHKENYCHDSTLDLFLPNVET